MKKEVNSLLKFLHPKDWYIELLFAVGILASIMGLVGAYWDIGWHFDFGRDTFWSPPHLVIYGGVVLMSIFWLLNLWMAIKTKAPEKRRPLFLLIISGVIGAAIVYSAGPLDELWHRLYGIDVVIWSFPHMLLIIGGIVGGLATAGIARYHITHERRKFLLEKIIIPLFLGSVLAGLMLVLAEGEFVKTLPLDHPVQNRPPWVYSSWLVIFSFVMFLVSKQVSELRFSSVFTLCAYVILRLCPVTFNYLYGMSSVPVIPQFIPLLLLVALVVDIVWRKTKN